ncbi:hypothetical protein HNQ93_001214 [Hymenobacter luteus]|uniref:Uncharacterized protein n=2 Tax=Hymenobacter TaxID=89966 RepID=A0A7W9T0D6_9BACT|nr:MULTISPECIES: hypothetical protein [Hymenobacter]MBB4601425.1 hypothetical protein [Hymenobacter latericoloratus]MBB6058368.1 hypothetical protein [Hymenobacter luteus]
MSSLTVLFRVLSVAALCAGATFARAQTTGAISLTQVAPAALRLRIENPGAQAGSVQVVRLRSGQTLFTETYTIPAYGHRFDFSQVPSGRYLVWVQASGTVHRGLVRVHTWNYGSSIRRIKLISSTMPAFGSKATASATALGSTNLLQVPQQGSPNQ